MFVVIKTIVIFPIGLKILHRRDVCSWSLLRLVAVAGWSQQQEDLRVSESASEKKERSSDPTRFSYGLFPRFDQAQGTSL